LLDEEVSAVVLAVLVVAVIFGISQSYFAGRVVEPFSAIALLGPEKKIGDYPREVLVGEEVKLYLYISNFEGKTAYYKVYVKLGNESTTVSNESPAQAPVIATYESILAHQEEKVMPVSLTIDKPMVNAKLIFEMWILDEETMQFKYHGRYLQLWLNVTAPPGP